MKEYMIRDRYVEAFRIGYDEKPAWVERMEKMDGEEKYVVYLDRDISENLYLVRKGAWMVKDMRHVTIMGDALFNDTYEVCRV